MAVPSCSFRVRALSLLLLLCSGVKDKERRIPGLLRGDPRKALGSDVQGSSQDRATAGSRAGQIREAMRFSWRQYHDHAFGHDDIKPMTGQASDWCRLAVDLLDGLDTLWLMDLKEEFDEGRKYLEHVPLLPYEEISNSTASASEYNSVFEIVIRALGGLLSAYALTEASAATAADRDAADVFLRTAQRLGDRLMVAFETDGILLLRDVDVHKRRARFRQDLNIGEAGGLAVEFGSLSRFVGNSTYAEKSDRIIQKLISLAPGGRGGLIGSTLAESEGKVFASGPVSVAANGDTYYEYLLKDWILDGKKDDRLKTAWLICMRQMIETLVKWTPAKDSQKSMLYVADEHFRTSMQHLTCFVPGMLMLGRAHIPDADANATTKAKWLEVATELTYTCWQMYERSPSKIGPNSVSFIGSGMQTGTNRDSYLRPEVVEALFYMYYYTGETKYQEWSWKIFEAYLQTKDKFGFAELSDVGYNAHHDAMQSFWMAETLKYMYLAQLPHEVLKKKIDLDKWVFSTEAHPLPVAADAPRSPAQKTEVQSDAKHSETQPLLTTVSQVVMVSARLGGLV